MINRESDIMKSLDKKFKSVYVGLLILTGLRLLNFDIWTMISDAMTALMVYFFLRGPNKCMALIVLINGVVSEIYGVLRLNNAWNGYRMQGNFLNFILVAIGVYAIIVYTMMTYYAYIGYTNLNDNTSIMPNNDVESGYQSMNAPVSNYKPFAGKGTVIG